MNTIGPSVLPDNHADDGDNNLVNYRPDSWEVQIKYYRYGSYRSRISTSSSYIESSRLSRQINQSVADDPHSSPQSAPSSIKSVSEVSQENSSDLAAKSERISSHQSSSTSNLSSFLRKITRLKKPAKSPWVLVDIEPDAGQEPANCPSEQSLDKSALYKGYKKLCRGRETLAIAEKTKDVENRCRKSSRTEKESKSVKSKSESKLQHIISSKQKPFQELKSLLRLGGSVKSDMKPSVEKSTLTCASDSFAQNLPPIGCSNIKTSQSYESSRVSPRRVVSPPHSLNLKDKIVVIHNQQVKGCSFKMTSMDSIGTCSLDLNNEKLSVTNNNAQRSISERSLKGTEVLEETTTQANKSSSSGNFLKNGHRLPSYVGISCAISGYSTYSRYCSPSQRDSLTRDLQQTSPSVRTMTPHSFAHANALQEPVNLQLKSETKSDTNHQEYDSLTSALNEYFSPTDGKDKTNCFNISQQKLKSDEAAVVGSSLVQQRIASLYGEQFAAGWRESRNKNKYKQFHIPKLDSNICSPTALSEPNNHTQTNQRTKSPPVFRHITKGFLEQLETPNEAGISHDSSDLVEPVVEVPSTTTKSPEMKKKTETFAQIKESTTRDGNWFLAELNSVTSEIKKKVDQTEAILLETDQVIDEEIAGKLRAAVGKANLLMSKKLIQFKDLCYKNINQESDDQFQTKNEDLEGFWDMVLLQINDINETFEEINKLRNSGWQETENANFANSSIFTSTPTKTPTKLRSRKFSPKASPSKSGSDKSSSDDSVSRDIERRNRLKEAKRRQAKMMTANCDDDNIMIFTPTTSKEP